MTLDDLRPAIAGRPAGALAERLVPDYPGRMPPILPREWLRGLDSAARCQKPDRRGQLPQNRVFTAPANGAKVGDRDVL